MEDTKSNQIQKTLLEKLGTPITQRIDVENEILGRLRYFHEGYKKRDESLAEEYVSELMDEHIQIIGTDGVYPNDREWMSGHTAAIELFRSDWKYWGDVAMFVDHAEISVEGNSGWVTLFGTVTRNAKDSEQTKFATSKSRSLQRIKEIAEDKEKPSTLAMYQIIQDASSVLSQYEQSEVFVWPLRISFGFVKRSNKWWMKQMHFSYPVQGFPSIRL
ncbi:MAG: hypothetical protein ACTSRE_01250 [Promethearchaeota archaeon]